MSGFHRSLAVFILVIIEGKEDACKSLPWGRRQKKVPQARIVTVGEILPAI
jgi:hypothetical protein